MELTKELLEKRLKVLIAQKEQVIARANAIEGGIITVRGLLSDLDREEEDENGEAGDESASPEVE